jgi:hypothetical protein
LSVDKARRIAANIAKLPELVQSALISRALSVVVSVHGMIN